MLWCECLLEFARHTCVTCETRQFVVAGNDAAMRMSIIRSCALSAHLSTSDEKDYGNGHDLMLMNACYAVIIRHDHSPHSSHSSIEVCYGSACSAINTSEHAKAKFISNDIRPIVSSSISPKKCTENMWLRYPYLFRGGCALTSVPVIL